MKKALIAIVLFAACKKADTIQPAAEKKPILKGYYTAFDFNGKHYQQDSVGHRGGISILPNGKDSFFIFSTVLEIHNSIISAGLNAMPKVGVKYELKAKVNTGHVYINKEKFDSWTMDSLPGYIQITERSDTIFAGSFDFTTKHSNKSGFYFVKNGIFRIKRK